MKALAVLLLVALPLGSPLAAVPDPSMSEVPDCISLFPIEGGYAYSVFVYDADGVACEGVLVEILFDATVNSMVAWCTGGAVGPDFSAVTSAGGEATFYFSGGGCVTTIMLADCGIPFAAEVFAGGVLLEAVSCVNSPDVVGHDGLPSCAPPNNNCEDEGPPLGYMLFAGLSDAVFHTEPIAFGLDAEFCTDFTEPYGDYIRLADAVILAAFLNVGLGCECEP